MSNRKAAAKNSIKIIELIDEHLDQEKAKIFIERRNLFTEKQVNHINNCSICQERIKRAKEDIAWHEK
ncbi:MAG: hypothetical protein U5L76_03840 [Patescibacteria group bacterium]|nr:hypothetical protein [Patescibacteria group bacterium]